MKKVDLIEMLNKIEGNPDILLWNGCANDWMEISHDLVEGEFVKESDEYKRRCLDNERVLDGLLPITDEDFEIFKEDNPSEWDFKNPHVLEKEHKIWYGDEIKEVVFIQGESRGISTFDRMGTIKY